MSDQTQASVNYRNTQMVRWSVIALCSLIAVIVLAAALTSGPLATRVACFPYVYTCTTTSSQSYVGPGNITCRCEEIPK